jgi:hypothetical protein
VRAHRPRARVQDLLGLGGQQQAPLVEGPVERLDAEAVARAHQAASAQVRDGDGPHALEPAEAVVPPRLERRQRDLGVTGGAEAAPARLQLAPQLAEVVDLAVEDDPAGAVGRAHRLVRRVREVADAQAAEPEPQHRRLAANRCVERGERVGPQRRVHQQEALSVRAAVRGLRVQAPHQARDPRIGRRAQHDADAAHR